MLTLDEKGNVLAKSEAPESGRNFPLLLQPCPSCACVIGENYLEACERRSAASTREGRRALAGLRAALQPNGSPFAMRYTRSVAGKRRYFEFSVLRVHGAIERIVAFQTELTSMVRKERARRAISHRYGLLAEFASAGCVKVDAKGRVIAANGPFLEMIREPKRAAVRRQDITRWIAEADRPRFRRALEQALSNEKAHFLQMELRTKEGESCRVALTAQNFTFGRQPRVVIFCLDLHAHKDAFEAWGENEARYHAIANSNCELVCRVRPDATLTFANAAFCGFFGQSSDNVIGSNLFALLPAGTPVQAQAAMTAAMQALEPRACEFECRAHTGESRVIKWVWHPVKLRAGEIEFHVAGKDFTQHRAAERALQESWDKVTDLTERLMLAHEVMCRQIAREMHDGFSQQVAALAIGLSLLARDFDAKQPNLAARINELCEEALTIGEGIRSFSHQLHPSVVDRLGLPAALRSLCHQLELQSGMRSETQIQEPLPALSEQMNHSLYRIVQETISNIVRHAKATTFRLRLHAVDSIVRLEVEDNGVGLNRDNLRQSSSLGLLSVEERVTYLQGKLAIKTAPGSGTRLSIELPLANPPPDETAHRPR